MENYSNSKYPLHTLFFEVTSRCNALCDHCGSRCTASQKDELSPEIFKKVLDDVAKSYGTKAIMLNITGGEPLMRKDLFDIAGYADSLGFKWGLVSNGMLITDNVVKKMKETHMSTISISLDGMKETHEEFRHVKGSFDKIISGIKKMKEENFLEHIQVTFIATKKNIFELPEVYRLLSMLEIDSLRISGIDPIGRAEDNVDLMLSQEDYFYLFDFMKKHIKDKLPVVWSCSHYFGNTENTLDPTGKKFTCYTGIHVASLLSNGDIFGCPNIPRRRELIQGNVLKDNFCEVWENKFEFYRNPDRTKAKQCENCKYWKNCKGDSFHTFDFETNTPKFCYKKFFEKKGNIIQKNDVLYNDIISVLVEKNGKMKSLIVEPSKVEVSTTVIITPQATKDLYGFFHFGEFHPSNLYEQQMALIGNSFANAFLVKYAIPTILYNRAGNMATMDDFCLKQIMDEVAIINENTFKSDTIYQDSYGDVKFLGFAHSHPDRTDFRFSVYDTKNHIDFVNQFSDFISIILNPQKEKIVCFVGKDCTQAKLIMLSK